MWSVVKENAHLVHLKEVTDFIIPPFKLNYFIIESKLLYMS